MRFINKIVMNQRSVCMRIILGTLLTTISTISPLIHFSMHIPDYITYIVVSNGPCCPVTG